MKERRKSMEMNQLYEKAFAFRDLGLWNKLEDDQIFADQVQN